MKQLAKHSRDVLKSLEKVKKEVQQDVRILVVSKNQETADSFIKSITISSEERQVFTALGLDEDKFPKSLIKPAMSADLTLIVLDEQDLFTKPTILAVTSVYELGQPFLMVLKGKDPSMNRVLIEKVERVFSVLPSQIVVVESYAERGGADLASKLLNQCSHKALALGRFLSFVRPVALKQVTSKTKWQNAFIGAVTIFPGADFPLLTLNQAKMVLMIAGLYGAEISLARARELLVVLGGGLTFRAMARELLSLFTFPGWVIKGAVAYTGTELIAKAAVRYFDSGLDHLTNEDLRDIFLESDTSND